MSQGGTITWLGEDSLSFVTSQSPSLLLIYISCTHLLKAEQARETNFVALAK